ncbi:hypothetical protein Y032_0042g689 [Ancylostoma ceylanicum]|uniref:Uncharacterized protein n=1 Tax=Ancylostoma ceylanicum TaxID=53326 RepID=A0A016UFJ1_9BILA|nr:hypothetical protein Y032_0042g689 [Ancylostoma ceylanicum]
MGLLMRLHSHSAAFLLWFSNHINNLADVLSFSGKIPRTQFWWNWPLPVAWSSRGFSPAYFLDFAFLGNPAISGKSTSCASRTSGQRNPFQRFCGFSRENCHNNPLFSKTCFEGNCSIAKLFRITEKRISTEGYIAWAPGGEINDQTLYNNLCPPGKYIYLVLM